MGRSILWRRSGCVIVSIPRIFWCPCNKLSILYLFRLILFSYIIFMIDVYNLFVWTINSKNRVDFAFQSISKYIKQDAKPAATAATARARGRAASHEPFNDDADLLYDSKFDVQFHTARKASDSGIHYRTVQPDVQGTEACRARRSRKSCFFDIWNDEGNDASQQGY